MNESVSEEILEIRFQPKAEFLDHRGTLAKKISEYMDLPRWQIDSNRIDVFADDRSLNAFVSFRNFGLTCTVRPTPDFFRDKAVKLVKFVLSQNPFSEPIHIERIGVRSRFGVSTKLPFEQAVKRYTERFVNLSSAALSIFQGKIVDIGIPFHLYTGNGTVNVSGGPMQKKQFREFFNHATEDSLPETGFYTDFDYWVRPERVCETEEIVRVIKQFAQENNDRYTKLLNLLHED